MWIENRKSYRRKQVFCAILGICVALLLTIVVMKRYEVKRENEFALVQRNLSQEVLRFHVLANSDSEKDQSLKLRVRDAILSYMASSGVNDDDMSLDKLKMWAASHLREVEKVSEAVIFKEGYDYEVKACLETCYFPDRTYGAVTFPKGYYEALRVEIGESAGKNWWCVLYPSLCFTDVTCAAVSEEGQEELSNVLCENDYETILLNSEHNFKIKSFFLEWWKEKMNN